MATILDRSFVADDSNWEELHYSSSQQMLAVQVVPTVSASRNEIKLRLRKSAGLTGNIWVMLYSDNSNSPNAQQGSNSANVVIGTGVGTDWADITFTFAAPIAEVAGVPYWIVLDGDYAESSSANIDWSADATTPAYAYYGFARWDGSNWTVTAGTTQAQSFKEYYDDTTIVSASASASKSSSASASASLSPSASVSASLSPSFSASASKSSSASASLSPSASESKSASASESESESPSESASISPSASESKSQSPSFSQSASESASESPSLSPSASLSQSSSVSASPSPAEYDDKYSTLGNSYTNKYTSVGSIIVD